MNNPWIEPMSEQELDVAKRLKDIEVVFDVGTRTSLEYLSIWPKAEFYLFEPHPEFFRYLKQKVGKEQRVHLNNYGLGEIEGMLGYDKSSQSFMNDTDFKLPIRTLNWYIKQNDIKRIDFLKIDTEKWDYKVLLGGSKAVKMAKYIQYETWNEPENAVMKDLLVDDFVCENIGQRNILCVRK